VAALALGRLTVVGVRDARLAERGAVVAEPEPVAADATATRPIRAGTTTGTTTTGTTTKDATTTGTTTARADGTGRPGSLHTFGRWLVARR
jgi:hypothetical protein